MKKLTILILAIYMISFILVGCSGETNSDDNNDVNEDLKPSIAGIQLGDKKEFVIEKLGNDYEESSYDVAGHFPETYNIWEYDSGYTIIIGRDSMKVLEIRTTSSEGETNLGIKVGDTAEQVFSIYRDKYVEPESIHGGKLIGWFKVEEDAVMAFDFDIEDGIANQEEISSTEKAERIILTYPEYVDESF